MVLPSRTSLHASQIASALAFDFGAQARKIAA